MHGVLVMLTGLKVSMTVRSSVLVDPTAAPFVWYFI